VAAAKAALCVPMFPAVGHVAAAAAALAAAPAADAADCCCARLLA